MRSVTRRTLTSAFERERSINFCNWRTLGRSPAFDAVKIRCRSRRTFSSQARQSTACQSGVASSGPFTATVVTASNLSSGSGALVIFLLTGSPDRVSPLSRPGTQSRIRPVIQDDQPEGPACLSWFPAAFRPPAFASRSSIPAEGLGLPCGRLTEPPVRTSTGFPRSTRTSCDRGGCLLYPGDDGAHPDWATSPASACRSTAASPCTPLQHPILRGYRSRDINGGSRDSPGKPGTSLCRAPLRTGRAPFNASGSSKPRWLAGGQKCRSRATVGIAPGVAVGVCETGFGLVRCAVLPRRDRGDRSAGSE